MTLRKLKWYIVAYVLLDLLIGYAGVIPLGTAAAAQFTTVTGTVVDPNGLPYANGTIVSVLILPGGTSPTLSGLPYSPPTQPVGLDANGSFTLQLADNNVLLPGGTTWNFTVCSAIGTVQPASGKGPVCFTLASPITITGTSQSISANLNAVALALTRNPGTGTVTSSGSPIAGNVPKFTSATNIAPAAATDIANLFSGCSGTLPLGFDGACHAAGTGTVTNTAGALTLGQVAIGNAANDLKVDTGLSTNGAGAQTDAQGTITTSNPVFNHSVTLNAGGVAFTNWVSNITCTAAATGTIAMKFGVAGNTWQFLFNGANCTNPQLFIPAGASANPALAIGSVTDGFWQSGSHNIVMDSNGFNAGNFNGSDGFDLNPGSAVAWCNTSVGTCTSGGSLYVGPLNEAAASGGVLQVGTTLNSENGLVRAGQCRVTADITLPVNTATTVCTWSLPATARAWAWQCEIPWVISAGSGTNTIAIIANPSQTPTAATNGFAEILTTNTGTATELTTAISVSGATTLLTSPTITPAATVFSARTSGTLLASGTAGTFSIQMTAAGTTATAAAKAGATCLLY
jgi:hypothetical protein